MSHACHWYVRGGDGHSLDLLRLCDPNLDQKQSPTFTSTLRPPRLVLVTKHIAFLPQELRPHRDLLPCVLALISRTVSAPNSLIFTQPHVGNNSREWMPPPWSLGSCRQAILPLDMDNKPPKDGDQFTRDDCVSFLSQIIIPPHRVVSRAHQHLAALGSGSVSSWAGMMEMEQRMGSSYLTYNRYPQIETRIRS